MIVVVASNLLPEDGSGASIGPSSECEELQLPRLPSSCVVHSRQSEQRTEDGSGPSFSSTSCATCHCNTGTCMYASTAYILHTYVLTTNVCCYISHVPCCRERARHSNTCSEILLVMTPLPRGRPRRVQGLWLCAVRCDTLRRWHEAAASSRAKHTTDLPRCFRLRSHALSLLAH